MSERSIVIIYHSGFGHTAAIAEEVARGCRQQADTNVQVISVDALDGAGWQKLDDAHTIVFGSPTYMGSASAPFKGFIDAAGSRWMQQQWKDKLAAGFTNSGSYSGDKQGTLQQLMANAMQHGMLWVGVGDLPPGDTGLSGARPDDINRLGSFTGLMTQAGNDDPAKTPPEGDRETARRFGARIAQMTHRYYN